MKLRNLFKKKKEISLSYAMRHILGKDLTKQLEYITPDKRLLVRAAAARVAAGEADLTQNLAASIDVPYLPRLEPIDVGLLTVETPLASYVQAGAILVFEGGRIKGIACVDPKRAIDALPQAKGLPFFMSTWSEISKALAASEEAYLEVSAKVQSSKHEKLLDAARQVFEMVWKEAERYERTALKIHLHDESIEYSFELEDGSTAVGSVNPMVGPALVELASEILEGRETELAEKLMNGNTLELAIKDKGKLIELRRSVAEEEVFVSDFEFQKQQSSSSDTEESESDSRKEVQEHVKATRTVQVMIVEDNPTFADVLKRYFGRHDIETVHFSDGLEALDALSQRHIKPSVIVSDLHMPNMDGLGLLEALQRDAELASISVITLTSDEEVDTEIEMIRSGASVFLAKSADPQLLVAHVQRILERETQRLAA